MARQEEEAIGRRSQPLPRVPFGVDTWWCQGMLVILTLFLPGTEVEIRWRGWRCHLPSNRLPFIRRVASCFGRSHSRSEARGSDITYAGTQDTSGRGMLLPDERNNSLCKPMIGTCDAPLRVSSPPGVRGYACKPMRHNLAAQVSYCGGHARVGRLISSE